MGPGSWLFPGGYSYSQAEDHLIGPKSLAGLALVYLQPRIAGIVQFIGVLEVYVFEEGGAYRAFYPCIPATKLEAGFIPLAKKLVLHVRDHGTDAGLGKQVQLDLAGRGGEEMPALGDIEKQEIGAIVQIIVKAVGCIECNGGIYGMVVHYSFDMGILVGKYEFGVIEIDLESPSSLLVEQEPQPIIVLRNGQRF